MGCNVKITDIEFIHNDNGEMLYVNVSFQIASKNKSMNLIGYSVIDAVSYKGNESVKHLKEIIRKRIVK